MADYEKLYEERKKRVETAVLNQEPDRVPNTLLVGTYPVSYTHLDVYKRQAVVCITSERLGSGAVEVFNI